MQLNRLIPMLPVRSLPVSIEFYQRLGFSVERRNDGWGWAMLRLDECRLMVDQSINRHPEAPRQSVLYLYPEDIVEYHRQVRRNGLAVPDLADTFYGLTEFRLDDPDGNRLWIGQSPPTGAQPGAATNPAGAVPVRATEPTGRVDEPGASPDTRKACTMITRIWHGWTTHENAAAYEALLREEIFVDIARRATPGYRGISLLKRLHEREVEFVTLMWFADLEAVRAFAGEDYEVAVVPGKARPLLSRFDARSAHYETLSTPAHVQP